SLRRNGRSRVRPIETASNTTIAIKKRIATNETGGKSRKPILMASQVELQTTQSVNHAMGTPQPYLGNALILFISAFRTDLKVYLPATQLGFRFSLNAAMPSRASSDSRACR